MGLQFTNSKTKFLALSDEISHEILHGSLQVGDNLPSINEASAAYQVSRDTVFKAYQDLKKKGLIDSNPMKGYYVKGEVNRVLLLLDNYSPFKQNLYNRFIQHLPPGYQVDLLFHQFNKHLFETILRESTGRYNHYVVMNFSNDKFSEELKRIPPQKLLLLDFGAFDKTGYSYICQDFNQALYDCLMSFQELISRYKRFVFIFQKQSKHPVESVEAFRNFCSAIGMEYIVYQQDNPWNDMKTGDIYLTTDSDDMVQIIQQADSMSFQTGSDIGIIAYNENPILGVIRNGITSIGIDFGLLGEKAANFVCRKEPVQEYLPTKLILRKSV